MSTVKLSWHNTSPEHIEAFSPAVISDLEKLDIDVPANLIYHHVFLGNTYDGPCVFVWGQPDSDEFHCEYAENTTWS